MFDSMYSVLYLEISLFCNVILFAVDSGFRHAKEIQYRSSYFRIMLIFGQLFILSDAFWALLTTMSGRENYIIAGNIASICYFSFGAVLSLVWFYYSEQTIGARVYKIKWIRVISAIPATVVIVMSVLSPITHWIFYIDSSGDYYRGSLIWVQMIGSYIPIFLSTVNCFILACREKNKTERGRDAFQISLYTLPSMVGAATQIIYEGTPGVTVGFTISAICFFIQILNRKQMEILQLEKARADESNQAKTLFLATMSHEIRTPINAVIGMNEMILRETTESNIREYAQDVSAAGKDLLELINTILDISRVETGKMELNEKEYSLSKMMDGVQRIVSVQASHKKLLFRYKIEGALPDRLYGDGEKLRQILINLLNNSVKYTDEGSVELFVDGTVNEEGLLDITCTVTDTGIAMKPEDLETLYDQFTRFDEEKNKNVEGSGLGLSITKKMSDCMGGRLEVSSEYSKGTVFKFHVSQKVVGDIRVEDVVQNSAITMQQTKPIAKHICVPEMRVLVVDDNRMNLRVAEGLLRVTLAKVTVCQSGKECLEKLTSEDFDLILLDIMMPEMDGPQTLQYIRSMSDEKKRNTPVIALTANAIEGMRDYYINQGFNGYLSKPIIPEELEKTLAQYQ